ILQNVEFGGVVEIVSSNNIKSDIESQHLLPVNDSNFQFSFANEHISDQCKHSSYAYWSWKDLSSQLSSPFCPTNLISSSQNWTYDYQSLNAKLDYIKSNNLAGVAIADITKDSKDLQLTNFILGIPPDNPSQSSPNTDIIVGSKIGSIVFVSALVAVGIILYRRRHGANLSNLLKDTNNQACSDINPQLYSDINRQ
ncbi:6151_t:CDS:2, partial [Racocetra persica]